MTLLRMVVALGIGLLGLVPLVVGGGLWWLALRVWPLAGDTRKHADALAKVLGSMFGRTPRSTAAHRRLDELRDCTRPAGHLARGEPCDGVAIVRCIRDGRETHAAATAAPPAPVAPVMTDEKLAGYCAERDVPVFRVSDDQACVVPATRERPRH